MSKQLINDYVQRATWKTSENASSTFSLQGLMQFLSTQAVSDYWLRELYNEKIRQCYEENRFHIHDLGFLSSYCAGWSIEDVLLKGFGGVENKIYCRPAKHLNTALNQLVNFLFTLQGELAGAQALSNLDTYLAPFVRYDKLTKLDVFKAIQSFVYSLNVPTRSGFQSPFTNISFDIICPKSLRDRNVIIGGEYHDSWTYGDFQEEMDIINEAFCDVMKQGDGRGSIFSFPIPTYNLTSDFDWESERHRGIWEMTAKYGIPYFTNFINSDLNPEDFRSMCCRLRLDVRKLQNKVGGMFGAAPLTGSVGVVTINLPNLALCAKGDERVFMTILADTLEAAKESLEIKREVIEKNSALYPYASYYLQSVKQRTGKYWSNHFSTIGIIGMHEALMFLSKSVAGITDEHGRAKAIEILGFIKTKLQDFQDSTGNIYNLEATPAESTGYKLAQNDKRIFGDAKIPEYYTNSTCLPVDFTDNVFKALDHQTGLQCEYTGGTVFHTFLGENLPNWKNARDIVRMMTTMYKIPYLSITPTFSVCKSHGYIPGEKKKCPQCDRDCLIYSRVVGYYRPVSDWNNGKKTEFASRKCYKIPFDELDIGGFMINSAIDYPGKPCSSVLFLNGCNLRCPWCHNGPLALGIERSCLYSGEEIIEMVSKTLHKNLVISGGEPTFQPTKLVLFLRKIRSEHPEIHVKLDTNGTDPVVLNTILSEKLVDYVAMDLKCELSRYKELLAFSGSEEDIRESIRLIEGSGVEYEFRTTMVPGAVEVEDLVACQGLLSDKERLISTQDFKPNPNCLNKKYRK